MPPARTRPHVARSWSVLEYRNTAALADNGSPGEEAKRLGEHHHEHQDDPSS